MVQHVRDTAATDTQIVDLPAGRAVRTQTRPERTFDGHTVRAENVQFFLPVPGGRSILVVTFSTPTLPYAPMLVEQFDAMAGSIDWAAPRGTEPATLTAERVDDAPWSVQFALPPMVLFLDPTMERATVVSAVDDHIAALGAEHDDISRNRLVDIAIATIEAARRSGAIGAALVVGTGVLPVEAHVLVFCIEHTDGADSASLDDLVASLRQRQARDVGHGDVSVVHTNGRPMLRSTGFAALDPTAGSSSVVALRQYLIPLPDTATMCVLSCWTPSLHAVDDVGEILDAVAAGVRIS
jgi:hypothetical protein